MLSIKKQIFNSVLVSASCSVELASAFMRFQEYYENPFWQDKIFTVGQFKKWYSEKYGADTYVYDWHGFNIPSSVLVPFKDGLFDPLTNLEKELIDFFKYRNDDFYIIGANENDVLKHELCHALYYTNKKYKEEIDKLLKANKKQITSAERHLIKKGYSKKVIHDEIQAYVLDGNYFEENKINLPTGLKNDISRIFAKHSN